MSTNWPDLGDVPCRNCGAYGLRIETRLEALPIGTYSLAGQQMKIAAREWPWMVCDNCKRESRGKVE